MQLLSHKTLAFVSGIAVLVIIGINMVLQEQDSGSPRLESSFTKEEFTNNTDTPLPEVPSQTPKNVDTPIPQTPPVVQTYTEGTEISLQGKGITSVPEYVFQKANIFKIDLSHNMLQGALPAEIRHVTELQVLDLSDNSFTGVPAEVGSLRRLEILDLSNNNLTGLPYEIGNLQNLKTLDVRGNPYSSHDIEIIRKALPSSTTIILE
jgi:Leucine-rich repeat (LRR) protein